MCNTNILVLPLIISKQYSGDLSISLENKCVCSITRHVEQPVGSSETLLTVFLFLSDILLQYCISILVCLSPITSVTVKRQVCPQSFRSADFAPDCDYSGCHKGVTYRLLTLSSQQCLGQHHHLPAPLEINICRARW